MPDDDASLDDIGLLLRGGLGGDEKTSSTSFSPTSELKSDFQSRLDHTVGVSDTIDIQWSYLQS